MSTITTSTLATTTAYSSQRKIDTTQNGVRWVVNTLRSGAFGLHFQYSTDSGATWAQPATGADVAFNGSGANYTPNASLFIDLDDFAHVVFKDSSDGFLRYTRGTPNAARTAYTWSTAVNIGGDASYDLPDVVAHRDPAVAGAWVVHVVASTTSAQVGYRRLTVSSAGTVTPVGTSMTQIQTGGSLSASTYPSIDFRHTGDGKTVAGGSPDLFVGWSAGTTGAGYGVRFRKASYSAGAWTWGTEREIDNTRYLPNSTAWMVTQFDGTRVVFTGLANLTTGTSDMFLHERDASDTTTTTRSILAGTSPDAMVWGSATYDAAGNVYLLGRASSTPASIRYQRWTRATATLGASVVLDASAGTSPYVSARRGSSGSRIDYVYTAGTASPYTVTYGSVLLNVAPNAPTLGLAAGTVVDRAATNRLPWTFSDPDTGDSQSKFDLQYRTGAGAWTTVTQSTPLTYWDAPGGTFAAGSWEWQVRTYDAQGVVGPWSASGFFTAATAPAAPTITAPANGGSVPTPSALLTWSAPSQDAYQVRRVADAAGTANTGTVYSDTGTVVDASARSRTVGFDVNNRTEHVQLRVRSAGLWSPWADVRVTVAYTPPATPVVTLAPDDTTGSLLVTITNPTPTGTQPAVVTADVLVDDGKGLERRATGVTGTTWRYWTPVGSRDYAGRVVVVAYAANGTTATGLAT